jgi:FtsP/CotA-like multicopper oxidase with cupredoxin domain
LNVGAGEAYEIAFVADNPGVWMDHCHNLPHAAEGLVAHLMYAGYSTPYRLGGASGNEPE